MTTLIHDSFIFYNELDLLEIRLHELFPVVDRFFLIEGDHTFTGAEKPSLFLENFERYRPYAAKIEHVLVEDWPASDDPWQWEFHQRNRQAVGLEGLSERDILICSDADEIPSREATAELRDRDETSFIFEQAFSYFKFDYVCQDLHLRDACWSFGERAAGFADFTVNDRRANRWRRVMNEIEEPGSEDLLVLRDAGWHASYLGDDAFVRGKIKAFSHQEFNTPEVLDGVDTERLLREGGDLFGRDEIRWAVVRGGLKLPHLVRESGSRFAHYLFDEANRAALAA